jgi:hypothetical protein
MLLHDNVLWMRLNVTYNVHCLSCSFWYHSITVPHSAMTTLRCAIMLTREKSVTFSIFYTLIAIAFFTSFLLCYRAETHDTWQWHKNTSKHKSSRHWLASSDLERMAVGAVVFYFEVLSCICNYGNSQPQYLVAGTRFNLRPFRYETEVLPTQPWCSVYLLFLLFEVPPNQFAAIPFSVGKNLIKKQLEQKHQARWTARTGCRQSKVLMRYPLLSRANELLAMSKLRLRAAVGLSHATQAWERTCTTWTHSFARMPTVQTR